MSSNTFDPITLSWEPIKSRQSRENANRVQPTDSAECLPGLVNSNAGIAAGFSGPRKESTRSSGTHLTVSDAKLEDLGPISDLCKAAQANDVQAFRLLLGKGQNLYMVSPKIYKSTPGHWAAYCNATDILHEIGALVTNDQQLTELFALKDWLNMTVIHMAAYQGHVAALLVLLDYELAGRYTRDIFELKDVWGKTAFDWAVVQGHTAAVEVLVLRKLQQLLPKTATPAVAKIHYHIRALQRAGIQSASVDTDHPEQLDIANLDVRLVVDLVLVCTDANMNILSVLLVVEDILASAKSYEALVGTVQQLTRELLDICKTKEEAQTILTPLMGELRAEIQPVEPVMYGLQTDKKDFIAHTQVQALLTEKFDPFGSFEYSNKPSTFFFWLLSATVIYTWWSLYMPLIVLIRPFNKALYAHTQKGKLMVTTRYPWHVPYNKWLAAYITHFIFLTMYTIVAISSEPTVRSRLTAHEWVLLTWAVGVLVDTAQECMEHRPAVLQGINMFEITASIGFILNIACRYLERFADSQMRIGMLSAASIFLSIGIFAMYVRSLGIFSVAPGIGPLLVMLRRMILDDGRKFLVVMVVILLAFVAALEVLFKPVCSSEEACVEYADARDLNWVGRGDLGESLAHLVYTMYGYGPDPDAWSNRPVAGSIFFTIFMSITSLLLMNLFIAMLADTYGEVKLQAAREYKFGRAVVIVHISRREAIYPPVNLMHLLAALLGNTLMPYLRAEAPGVPLRKTTPDDVIFLWYNPTNERLMLTRRIRSRIFNLFAKRCAEKYGRTVAT